jgi:predicted Zn-dependent peptidase
MALMAITWEIDTLANGMRVVTTPVPTAQSVSVNVFVGVGSRFEQSRVNGISHYIEHMLFKGTTKRPDAIQIAQAIEGSGGVLNAYTGKEATCYWNHVPYDAAQHAMEVLADMVLDSLFVPEEIEKERSVVKQEIKRGHDQPGSWVGELLSHAVYGDQPIGWSIAGSPEIIDTIQRPDFVEHLDTWYRANNMVLSVAGNVQHCDVVRWAEELFGGAEPGTIAGAPAVDPRLPEERLMLETRPIAQSNLAIGLRSIGRADPDRFILSVLTNLLGRGMSSRLFREVRERRGLAYSVGASASRYDGAGSFVVSAGVSPENLTEATRVILAELDRLVDEPVPEEELKKARDYTTGSFRLGLESTGSLGQRHGDSLLSLGRIEPIDDVVAAYQAVTPDDVRRVARRVFATNDVAMAVVGPEADRAALESVLAGRSSGV